MHRLVDLLLTLWTYTIKLFILLLDKNIEVQRGSQTYYVSSPSRARFEPMSVTLFVPSDSSLWRSG